MWRLPPTKAPVLCTAAHRPHGQRNPFRSDSVSQHHPKIHLSLVLKHPVTQVALPQLFRAEGPQANPPTDFPVTRGVSRSDGHPLFLLRSLCGRCPLRHVHPQRHLQARHPQCGAVTKANLTVWHLKLQLCGW